MFAFTKQMPLIEDSERIASSIRKVSKIDERLVILLNIDRILTQEEKVELEKIIEKQSSVRQAETASVGAGS